METTTTQLNMEEIAEKKKFWLQMFRPRTKKYLRDTLKRLKKGQSSFETAEERYAKIEAIKEIL